MKTILATAYAVNPYKGSEDGMGWNLVLQIARFNKVIAITRENNKPHIDQFKLEYPNELYNNITFLYFDLPYYLRFWKKGQRGAMLYFYLWQRFVVSFIKQQHLAFDIVHNLNFHNDWTPSFLWKLNKPFVWGPVGHHPQIPAAFLQPYARKEYLKDRATWFIKKLFWNISPALKQAKHKAHAIIAMNSSVKKQLTAHQDKFIIIPSVSSERVVSQPKQQEVFRILSVGRFVPLKGFDVTLKAFATFYHQLSEEEKKHTELVLVGDGPYRNYLQNLATNLGVAHAVKIILWVKRAELASIYQGSSVFLFPSHEGAGMVVAEALSYGLPVLCFNNCGPGEFITEACGIKVDYSTYENSVRQFSLALEKLFHDQAEMKRLSNEAKTHFEANFTWETKGEKFNAIYQQLSA